MQQQQQKSLRNVSFPSFNVPTIINNPKVIHTKKTEIDYDMSITLK